MPRTTDKRLVTQAKILRARGGSYNDIAKTLNRARMTVYRWLNAAHRNQKNELQRLRLSKFPGRAEHAIANAKWQAAKYNHAAPNFTKNDAQQCFERQNGMCPITGTHDTHTRLVLDHCHSSGNLRGWISPNCNKILGLAKDDKNVMTKLAEYLDGTA